MAELPSANVFIDDEAGAFGGGTGYAIVMGCVEKNADLTPRVFASTKALLAQHGYSQAADYCSLHFEGTKKPVVFVGLPTATAGTIGRQNSTGVTGSCAITIAAGLAGVLDEVDAKILVKTGGTIGVNGIVFDYSLDGGRTFKTIRLGTASSYTIPYVGLVINFGAGTLNANDVYTFTTTAPMWDAAGLTAARQALAAQQKLARTWMVIGDLSNSTFAGYVTTEANAYDTAVDRFVVARAQLRDRLPLAAMAKVKKQITGTQTLTFAVTANTITRSAGSWIADGFAIDDQVTVSGTVSNNVTGTVTALTATVMTVSAALANEGPTSNYAVVGSSKLVFASGGNTVTRFSGNWFNDGFAIGDSVTITGTASNNYTKTITNLTSTVMTFASGVVSETIRSDLATFSKGETMAAWMSGLDAAFASVDGQRRADLAAGRLRHTSPITAWFFRRPVAWAASIREYQHDIHIPTYRKSDGPLLDWSNTDADGKVVEFDERTDGGGLAARFTCSRTYANGPNGPFIALSLTRAAEGSLLSRTHNMQVANLACTVAHAETENVIGQVLVLNDDGTGSDASLSIIEERVNSALQIALLQARAEGQRASMAKWTASRTDILNTPGATLTGTLDLNLNGTVEQVTTRVRIQTGG
jgi:hypothetical protein